MMEASDSAASRLLGLEQLEEATNAGKTGKAQICSATDGCHVTLSFYALFCYWA